jgi:pteridine reductase
MDLNRKVALVTGGARIGAAVAKALAQKGASLALTWRHSKAAAINTLRDIEDDGGQAVLFRTDLSNPRAIAPLINTITHRFGRLDILVNMASVYEPTSFARSPRAWQKSLDVDLRGAYLLAHAAAPAMKKQGAGRMINFADWTAASGRPRYKDFLPYYVSKSGVIGLTEGLALELSPEILVNAVAPGPILAPKGSSAAELEGVRQATPLARWGGAEEIVKAVLFLIETDFVTGECLRVDGGRHLL